MKKILVIFLVLVMVLPMCLVSGAEEQTQNNRPYTILNWGGVPKKYDPQYVYGAPYFWIGENDVSDQLAIYAFGSYSVKKTAAAMKEEFDKRPDGTRYINFDPIRRIITHFAENYIYLDKGANVLAKWMDKFLKEYQSIGGKLDGIIMDCEYIHMGYYYIGLYAQQDVTLLNKIVQDPRYQTEVRPLLEERGFTFWDKPSEYTPEIYTIMPVHGDKYAKERAIWNTVMEILRIKAMNTAITEPMLRYYPDATTSDYQTMDMKGWYNGIDSDSGTSYRAGNATNNNMYFIRPREDFYESPSAFFFNSPDSSYIAPYYDQTPFNQALYELNMFKESLASCDAGKIQIWIPFYDYGYHWPSVYDYYDEMASNTPYYSEIIFHMATLDPHPFLGYIVESDVEGYGDYSRRVEIADQVMIELNRVLGADDRKTIMVPSAWNDSFILSGMYTGGRNVWRITPDTKKVSVENFLVEQGENLVFSVNGKTITFPGGKIIADGTIEEVGTCGYWVETAADVYPEYSSDADRFENYPAFQANFENWALGAFDYNKVYPLGGWDTTRDSGAVIEVVKNGDDQALSITGSVYLENIKMPANINAGDGYAKKQSWSMEVTIPEGLSADTELYILKYNDERGNVEDTAFLVTGGKLYYDQEGESIELCDIAAGTYTFVRQMDFANLEEPLCSYYVYNADGSTLASAENIKTMGSGKEVYTIGIDCVDADKAILIDDYTIRIWGLNAELTLYNAFTGMKLEDQEAAFAGDAAYRLGWLNASNETVTAQVMAAVYEGETLVSEYVVAEEQMLPGDDHVLVGVVDIGDGQTVKLSLQTAKANLPGGNGGNVGNGGNGGNGGGVSGSNNTTTIIILLVVAAVVCTLCAAAPVVAVVLLDPNKRKK